MSARPARLPSFFAGVGHGFDHLLMLLYPTVVLGLEGKFGLSYGELLALATPSFILFGAGALPAGWLGDRWSAEHMMVLFFVGSGGAAVLTGLATGPLGLVIGLSLMGLFASIYHPVGVAWLVQNAENRGRALGWNGIWGSAGIGFASLVAGALTDLISWRAAFILPGALCIAFGVALLLLVRAGSVVAAASDRKPEPEASRQDVVRAFIVLSVTMLGAGIIGQVSTVAMPKVFAERLPALISDGAAGPGFWVSVVFIFAAVAQVAGGWLADRFPLKLVYCLAWAAQIPVFIVAASLYNVPLLGAVVAASVLGVLALPAENSLLARYSPGKWRATLFGAKFVLSLGVSSLGVPLAGIVYDRTGGFWWLFLILGVVAAIVALAALFLPTERREPAFAPVAAE
jgi:MFS family permease